MTEPVPAPPRIAYLVSRFPKVTETFVLFEMLALEEAGVPVSLYAFVREHEATSHPEAARFTRRAWFPRRSGVLLDQLYWLRHAPGRYLRAWAEAIIGNLRSPKFLARAIVATPVAASIARDLQRRGIRHVHAHWATHPALAALVAHRLTGIRYSFTAHAHDIYVDRTMLDRKIANAAFIVTISEYNRRLLAAAYPTLVDRVRVIRCGTDLSVFGRPAARPPMAPLVLVCVASLQPQKGHLDLVRACRVLIDRGIELRCLLIGEGEERARIEERVAALGLGAQVTLLGSQPRPEVVRLLGEAHIGVQPRVTLPSGKQEGIPVALMEAMATGLPVVATRISGVPELVRDEETGLLVDQHDPLGLADAIERLAGDPALRERLGVAARETVLATFDLRENAAALGDLLVRSASGR
jgi:glycosyltransferase involved in cell wall biosynthesis